MKELSDWDIARISRYSTVLTFYLVNNISREEALEILCAELTPGKPFTFADDRKWLDKTPAEIFATLWEAE